MTTHKVCRPSRWCAAGVSLIEALVALAVMAFGILGVVGMQSTMRAGADISRQRSEAVRIAQERLEYLRNYSVLLTADKASTTQLAYQEIVAALAAPVAASHANTTFFLETVVPTAAASDAMAAVRQVRVIVTWADRSASAPNQRVELTSAIAGLPAELSGLHAMRTDRSPLRQFRGRHAAIPRLHITENSDGTTTFTPPGLGGQTWIFNNSTGLITQICSAPPSSSCMPTDRWLLSGYVAFATASLAAPTASAAERPTDAVVNLSMKVEVYEPDYLPPPREQACATENTDTDPSTIWDDRVAYYCAVPSAAPFDSAINDPVWSGKVVFETLPLAGTLADASTTKYKVCRYTPDPVNLLPAAAASLPTVPASQTVSDYNSRHPYIYYRVNGPLQNKNFLVIRAGNGTVPFSCPADNSSTPIESGTWPHEPIS